MQFLNSLFGGSENTFVTATLALGIVLVLIVLGVWLLKLVFKASGSVGRGRNRRLAVIDSMAIDPKRQLVIVRRDNVEHVILTGGPQDMLVESGIPVQPPIRAQVRRPAQATPAPQRATQPQKPGPTAQVKVPVAQNDEPMARSAFDNLRELGRPAGQRRSTSLRHTGLMRPVSRMEPGPIPGGPDNSDAWGTDSARTGQTGVGGQAQSGEPRVVGHRGEDRKAEGN